MKRTTLIGSAILTIAFPAVVHAEDGRIGYSSSASATVTVIIPPIQAGIDASNEGAVGLWTLGSESGGLLVKLPDQVASGESSKLEVFRTDGNVFDVSLQHSAGVTLSNAASSETNGLKRQSFVLSNLAAKSADPVEVMITAI